MITDVTELAKSIQREQPEIAQLRTRAEAAEAEVKRLREELEQCRADLKHEHERAEGSEKAFATQFRARQAAEAEVARLHGQVATLEHATCSCCDRPVNRCIDAVVCDWCYEDRLT